MCVAQRNTREFQHEIEKDSCVLLSKLNICRLFRVVSVPAIPNEFSVDRPQFIESDTVAQLLHR